MGYPVVLIHGMWSTGASWARIQGLLEARGYPCYAPTLPGHAPVPEQPLQVGARSLRDYLQFLESWVAEQQFDRPPILIGHSMGALLAQQLATRINPLALTLLTPAASRGINNLAWSNVVAFAPWLLSGAFWRNPHKPSARRASISLFNGIAPERHQKLYEGLVHESGRAAAEIGFWWADGSRASTVRSEDVRCPVYVVSCGADRLTPAPVVRRIVARYPSVALRYYPARGHWVIDDEDTEEMMHSICGWLRPLEQRHEKTRRDA